MVRRIAVIGVGTMGAQALLHLSGMEDVEAVGFESFAPGHPFGAAGGENRIFTSDATVAERSADLLARSMELWSRQEQMSGRELVARRGYLSVVEADSVIIDRVANRIPDQRRNIRVLDVDELRSEFGFQRYRSGDIGLYDPEGGMIRTDEAIATAASLARSRGASIHVRTRVTSIEETPNGVTVRAGSESSVFDSVLVTTGSWAHALLPGLVDEVAIHSPVSAWFLPREPNALRSVPALARHGRQQFYAGPAFDGRTLKVGYAGGRQRRLEQAPEPEDRHVDPVSIGEFPTILRDYLTGFEPQPVRLDRYFEGYTRTGYPVIERAGERIAVGVGFSGNGFKLAPVYGRALANFALGEPLDPAISRHDPSLPAAINTGGTK